MKISKKYSNMLVAAFMPFVISLVTTFHNTMQSASALSALGFLAAWMLSWLRAYSLALPVSLLSAPFIRKLVDFMTQ